MRERDDDSDEYVRGLDSVYGRDLYACECERGR